jgi:ubiquinone/menaquinone biosynthesis C-methylase UbiE
MKMDFYARVLQEMIDSKSISTRDSVVVVCGGSYDVQILQQLGFTSVTITNVDDSYDCAPYSWKHEDAENLTFADSTFDWAFVHAGLHHCASPHRGLLEMCRVAKKGVLVIEARDSALIRLAVRFGLVPTYELEAVALNDFTSGGVRNSAIPNFIYRWTERETRKTVESAYPGRKNGIQFFYGMVLPTQRLSMNTRRKRVVAGILGIAARLFQFVFPKQCNLIGFLVTSSGAKPWIEGAALSPRFKFGFDPKKYVRRQTIDGDRRDAS